jgi:rhodanese-related sulfurtransferase
MESLRINVEDAKAKWDAGDVAFVDVRNPDAWRMSNVKLPGALRILGSELDDHIAEIPREKTVIAYCT